MAALSPLPIDVSLDAIPSQIVTPADLLNAVAPRPKYTHLLWFAGRKAADPKGKAREWFGVRPDAPRHMLEAAAGQHDVYYTPNEFLGWRLGRLLTALNAFYVDIDVHGGNGCPVAATLVALDKISAAHLPEPNLIVWTGRGAHVYWLFNRTSARALPRWQSVQRELVRITGGDGAVVDCTRVLRLVGTVNSKAEEFRRTVNCEVRHTQRYEFDWLCDQIIKPRAEIHDLRAARAARGLVENRRTGRNYGSITTVWYHRYQDMLKIIRKSWPNGGVPVGERNNMLYYCAVALSWITAPEALKGEVAKVASQLMPDLTDAQISNCIISVLDRATKAGEGQKIDGMDARYRYRSETLWQCFQPLILAHPDLLAELKSILPPAERKARKKAEDAKRDRVEEGRYTQSRSTYLAQKAQRFHEAVRLYREGKTSSEIAQALQVSVRAIQGYLRTFKASTAPELAAVPGSPTKTQQKPLRALLNEIEAEVLALREKLATARQIVLQLGITPKRVWRALRRLRELGLCWTAKSPPDLNVAVAELGAARRTP